MRIFVTGQCSLHWGRLENGNIGNYYITETTFRELHRVFPNATIVTTFQMTEEFQKREYVNVVPMELFYNWDDKDLTNALEELGIATLYSKTGKLVSTTPYIEEVLKCDLFVDFSGEMWGYHADLVGKNRFLVGLIKDRVAQLLKKPTVMLAGSQGRFPDPNIKKFAKEVFENFSLVANREAETGKLLIEDGFDVSNLKNFACPAFLFKPASDDEIAPILKKENIDVNKNNKVGFILCGFNMTEAPYDKWPRDDDEYIQFAEVIEYIVNELGCEIFFMSHSNGFELPPNFKLIQGRDYPIVKQLRDVVKKRGFADANKLHLIDGPYDPKETKAIIRHFDMFVTGRLHGSVAATSECVPTVVLMHAHGQKSHKTIGFFDILQLPNCVSGSTNSNEMISKVKDCWNNREKIRKHLNNRIPEVKQLASNSFDSLKSIVDK
jgi:colanic acid/amylovoran biosynthesis protein